MTKRFKALVVREDRLKYSIGIEEKSIDDLPKNEVLIRVHFSSLNYKDGLSSTGDKTVTRHYPHTPGIDAAGIVEKSNNKNFKSGDQVIVISNDLGANTPGGYGQYICVPSSWVMPLPKGLTLKESMIYGTAGFTAALAVFLLKKNQVKPENGPVLVTGATGGVGSVAVSILSNLGYEVIASTGKKESELFLHKLGASKVIRRDELVDEMNRTLLKEHWSGALDTVGGKTLETVLKSCKKRGVVISSGLVSSPKISMTVFPFILRGISLIGTGASETSIEVKNQIWLNLAKGWKLNNFDLISKNCKLEELETEIQKILNGQQQGRIVVDLRN